MRARLVASAVSAGFLAAMLCRMVLLGGVGAGVLPAGAGDMPLMCAIEGVVAVAASVAVLSLLPRLRRWQSTFLPPRQV